MDRVEGENTQTKRGRRRGIERSLTEVDDPEGAGADLPAELELAADDAVHAAGGQS